MKKSQSKNTNLATATSPLTILMTSDTEVITLYGNKTLSANFAIQASGTPASDTTVTMIFTGSIATSGNTFSIFGVSLDADVLKTPWFAICYYTNAAWTVAYGRLRGASYVTDGGLAEGADGGLKIDSDVITNEMIKSDAAIIYSKLVLTNSIVNADIAPAAAVAYSKLNLTGAILNADLAGSIAYAKLALTGSIVNADISAAAEIDTAKLKALTASELVITGAGGLLASAPVATYPSLAELAYLKGVTSGIQAQIAAAATKVYVDSQDAILAASVAAINPSVKTLTTVTGTTTLTAATIKNNVLMDTVGGAFTLTLPLASTLIDGYEIKISCTGHVSNVATIACNASDKIVNQDSSGAVGTLTMAGYFKSYTLQLDKATSTWLVIVKVA